MDTTYGVLCLIPPIVAIGLALWTKQTIFSLFIAVWLGSTMMNGFNPLVGFVKIISDYMIPSLSGNASLIILVTLSGGMIAMLRNEFQPALPVWGVTSLMRPAMSLR